MRQILAASAMGVYVPLFVASCSGVATREFPATRGNFFIFKTSGGAERFTTEERATLKMFTAILNSNASGAI
jgi:hypothetical protein